MVKKVPQTTLRIDVTTKQSLDNINHDDLSYNDLLNSLVEKIEKRKE